VQLIGAPPRPADDSLAWFLACAELFAAFVSGNRLGSQQPRRHRPSLRPGSVSVRGLDLSDTEEIRAQALAIAAAWASPGSPESSRLTSALFRHVATHDRLLDMLAGLPADRMPALLASAAITFLVHRTQPEPLVSYFPEPGVPQRPLDAGFEPAAAAFVSDNLEEIDVLCRSHRYQMNEVARCTQITIGIAAVTSPAAESIALVDLGTGAGLGLQLDRYQYRVGGTSTGPADGLTLTCELRGERRPPLPELPRISRRVGIDIDPVDLGDRAAIAWLVACAPPEVSAVGRLAAAIEVARRHPPPIVAGDVVAALPGVLAGLPSSMPVVVTDAYLAVFLARDQRARLFDVLASAGRSRPVTWLSLDPLIPPSPAGRDSVQGLQLPAWLVADYQQNGLFAILGARTFDRGCEAGRLLARAHPSGQWVEWLS
jgi:hypothetical protein